MSSPAPACPRFQLDLSQPSSHLVGVRLQHTPRRPQLRFALPAWTPGSYLIRDYVRQLEGLELHQGGQALPLRRVGTSQWQVALPNLEPVEIRYRILATELTVRTCHLDGDHGFLALAAVVLELEGERWSPQTLELRLPPQWQAFVPLPENPSGGWRATSFDQLVDTPVEVGPHRCHQFSVAGVPHRWVSWGRTLSGEDLPSPAPRWLGDVEQVCLACCRLMGVERPAAAAYLFVLHLNANGYGGLEHDSSTVLQFGRRRLAQPAGRRKLLQLVAHEYLHQWNVRRLRPAELSPYDYGQAVVIPTLWFAEGITSYVDQLLPHSAGLCSAAEVLDDLGADLSRYLLTPGRAVQSLRQSGEEAWVKLYRADADAPNNQISYYLKGAVLALVLDLHLRRVGSGLPVVLRQLWRRLGCVGRGYHETDLLEAFAAQAPDLQTLLPAWLEGLEDPPLAAYLADVGLSLQPRSQSGAWVGWQLKSGTGGLTLQRVVRDSPAQQAGLMVGDELLALHGWRLHQPDDVAQLLQPEAALSTAEAGIPLLYARDGQVKTTLLRPASPAVEAWDLKPDAEADAASLDRRHRWLSLELP
ncbi:PDZ domain-containing protein [Cyanobium sp. LEGE 06113]|uniref:M61 family metallopeptidase n=1 Tax=Cyanobium sp. LEGE 06113 TaxID=1297573 RepID=UPI00187F085C|nr:M61 family metallopeptidase [Cyanobium sp. LEGE 06113]